MDGFWLLKDYFYELLNDYYLLLNELKKVKC